MVRPRMFGIETEYAFATLDQKGTRRDLGWSLHRLMKVVRETLPHLPELRGHGVFLCNGGRFYVDCGHPELTTPECTSPSEAVRYVLAGHRILRDMATRLAAESPEIGRVFLGRCHVDYVNGHTWGCHESYLHRCHPEQLPDQIVPHLVSRILYSGSGGFNNLDPGIEFLLEPRVAHLVKVISGSSTSSRGIYHTRNEALCRGFHRLHILAGASNCCHKAAWLKIGTTALIVAIIEHGASPGDPFRLADPVRALQRIARDPVCQTDLMLSGGKVTSAIEIQRHYLKEVEKRLDRLPEWAPLVCREWRSVLEALAGSPLSLFKKLDWPLKLALFKRHVERKGMSWGELNRLPGQELEALRSELFLIDTSFSLLLGEGIFENLERSGVLDHRVPGVDHLDRAREHPPAATRAWLRGEQIRQLATTPGVCCGWESVIDREGQRCLDLSDPFSTVGRWRPLVSGGAEGEDSFLLSRLLRHREQRC